MDSSGRRRGDSPDAWFAAGRHGASQSQPQLGTNRRWRLGSGHALGRAKLDGRSPRVSKSEFEVRFYFTPSNHSFWRWRDAGQVIDWCDGRTIAFREELLGVLEQLAPQGLPPLGAVLLVLAA